MPLDALEARWCGVHPEALAVDTCTRCGVFTCGDCLQLFGDRPYCNGCFSRGAFGGKASTRSRVAVGFGAAGMLLGAPVSAIALVLAGLERRAWRGGETNAASAGMADAAWILGWLGVALTVIAVTGIALIAWAL